MWWRLLRKKGTRDVLLAGVLALVAAGLVAFPLECSRAAREGLRLCANVIIPSLFPFFVVSSLLVDLGLAGYVGRAMEPIMRPLFRVNGACASALALGWIGGYPVGARTAISLYRQGMCSRAEAQRLLAFCNNSGPAFILGVVGAGVFGSGRVGMLLYLTHILASCLVGLLFRRYGDREEVGRRRTTPVFEVKRFTVAFTQAVTGSAGATLNICAFVVFFTVILRLAGLSGAMEALAQGVCTAAGGVRAALPAALAAHLPAAPSQEGVLSLLTGLVELTGGVSRLGGPGAAGGEISLAAFMLGWAGLSIHCQTLSFLGDSGLSPTTYLAGKLLHGCISSLLAAAVLRVFPIAQPVSAVLREQVDTLSRLDGASVLAVCVVAAWCVLLVFFFFAIFCGKRRKTML